MKKRFDPSARRTLRRDDDARRREPSPHGDVALIWGHHPVREALRSRRRVVLRLQATAAAAARLAAEITARGLEPEIVDTSAIAARTPAGAPHQGLLLEARPLENMAIDEAPTDGLLLVLDQVTDPHNFGAIVRTAAAFAVDAIVTTERHSPALSGVVAKSASGGLEHVPVCEVVNLARALETLEDKGYARVGLDSAAPGRLHDVALARPLALVLGAEGQGLRRLTRENCSVLARLDLPGPIRSLNVSNACAVALTIVQARLAAQSTPAFPTGPQGGAAP